MLYLITYLEEIYHKQRDFRETNKQTFKLSVLFDKVG